ncbi:hypothetical protein PRZ48_012012 [Zasmidium cellare]|uniref:C2H2-type domain-containing protein n=1 Tax=Zasmidium cellare TaxID=395010 RepID=A0ABR0E8L5_ZASCE|nr:hypothetical protein PRZ48_012012 [Zasmidium cellare]
MPPYSQSTPRYADAAQQIPTPSAQAGPSSRLDFPLILNKYGCPVAACNRIFDRYIAAYYHFHQHHGGQHAVKCPEEGCTLAFTMLEALERHWNVFHNEDFLVYNCIVPGCSFAHGNHEAVVTHLVLHHGVYLPLENRSKPATIARRHVNCRDWFLARGFTAPDPSFFYPKRPGAMQRPSQDCKNGQLILDLQTQEAQKAALTAVADRHAAAMYNANINRSFPVQPRAFVPSGQMPIQPTQLLPKGSQVQAGDVQHNGFIQRPHWSLQTSSLSQQTSMSHHQNQQSSSQHASASDTQPASRQNRPGQNAPAPIAPQNATQSAASVQPQRSPSPPAKRKFASWSYPEYRGEAAAAMSRSTSVFDDSPLPPPSSLLSRSVTQEDVLDEAPFENEYTAEQTYTSAACGAQIPAKARPTAGLGRGVLPGRMPNARRNLPASLPMHSQFDSDVKHGSRDDGSDKTGENISSEEEHTQARDQTVAPAHLEVQVANDEPESPSPPPKKRRGRPPKPKPISPLPKRPRGRPPKNAANLPSSPAALPAQSKVHFADDELDLPSPPPKRPRGRPPNETKLVSPLPKRGRGRPPKNADSSPSSPANPEDPAEAQRKLKWAQPIEDIIALNQQSWPTAEDYQQENIRWAIHLLETWDRTANHLIWEHLTESAPRAYPELPELADLGRQLLQWASTIKVGINPRRAGGYMRICLRRYVKHYPSSIFVGPTRWLQDCLIPGMEDVVDGNAEDDWRLVVTSDKSGRTVCERGVMRGITGGSQADFESDNDWRILRW